MSRKPKTNKILMLGVDGLDPRFACRMLREGKMPNLKKYIEKGACRKDLTMLGGHPTVTPAMWTTLATGCYANVHGITGFNRYCDLGLDYMEYNLDSRHCKAEPLWNVFAESGKKTLVWHWPGSSWPPTSDNENLYVVDGSSPGSVGMSTGQFDVETILTASETIDKLRYNSSTGEITAACAITGMEVEENSDEGGFTFSLGALKNKEIHRIVVTREDGILNGDKAPVDRIESPIVPAKGWNFDASESKEFVIPFSHGMIRRYGLIEKNADGKYDSVKLFKSKKDIEPMATLRVGVLVPTITDEGERNDQIIECNHNLMLLELSENGDKVRLYISAGMANDVSAIFHPKELHDEVVRLAGHAPATSLLGNQDAEHINKIMLDNWTYTADWQAKALNGLIDEDDFEVIFSHYHAVDQEGHSFIRYMSDKGYNKLPSSDFVKFFEDVYIQCDNYLGQFLHRLDEGWTVFVFSDHGLVCSKHDFVLMGDLQGINTGVMEELGLSRLKRDKNGNKLPEFDWEHTIAVAQRESHIYLNLKGRDEHGIINPEDKYEVEEEIITRLYNYRDKKTGKRIIALALRNKDAVLLGLGGPDSGDIIYFLAEGYNFDHADSLSTTYGVEETSVSPIFVGAGKGLKSRCTTERIIRQVDFAASVAYLGGVRMPAHCEGAPVYQILEEEF